MLKNVEVCQLTKCEELSTYIDRLQGNFMANIIKTDNDNTNNKLLFNGDKQTKRGRKGTKLLQQAYVSQNKTEKEFCLSAIQNSTKFR